MIEKENKSLEDLRNNFRNLKIAVIGDMMVDGYFWGDVRRISPEAPVPIVEVDREFFRFGGAANVALNIKSLSGIPLPIGIIGEDNDGGIFKSLLDEAGIKKDGIISIPDRPTTMKTRVIADNQHIVRIDKENKELIEPEYEKMILQKLESVIDDIDSVILEDYNKGVLTENLIGKVIALCNKKNKIVTVDPKFQNFFNYRNVTLFKPNKKETEDAYAVKLDSWEDIEKTGFKLLDDLNSTYILLTMGQDGLALFEREKEVVRIPTKARKVADVSGAGDTVISTLTMALCAGADIADAAYLANFAGGIVCEETGIVPIEIENLFEKLSAERK